MRGEGSGRRKTSRVWAKCCDAWSAQKGRSSRWLMRGAQSASACLAGRQARDDDARRSADPTGAQTVHVVIRHCASSMFRPRGGRRAPRL